MDKEDHQKLKDNALTDVQNKQFSDLFELNSFFQEYNEIKTNFNLLLDELDHVRGNLVRTEEYCQKLELRCKLLEERLVIERADREKMNNNKREKAVRFEQQSCEQSNDSLNHNYVTTRTRKPRRSSSVPMNVAKSAPSKRDPLKINIALLIERQDSQNRRSFDSEPIPDMRISRQHTFISKRNFSIECFCDYCKEPIRYCVVSNKCDACKLSYHESCSRKLDMPCLPHFITPKSKDHNIKALRLADFCPDTNPMIPHLIVHCIMHLERIVYPSSLYATFGDDSKAMQLLNDFKNRRSVPNLIEYDTQTIAGCIMLFLMQIRDPLIMFSSHQEFFKASNEEQLLESINSLPTTHRDTLVYLVNHWKRVCDCSFSKNSNTEILCDTLGPIVFGTSRQLIDSDKNKQARAALLKIFNLPFDSLKNLLNQSDSSFKGILTRHDSDSRKPLITIKAN